MRGELSSARFSKRHPLDWYVDESWCAEQLFNALGGFEWEWERDLAIWDPCAGLGNTLDVFAGNGFRCYASDLVDNLDRAAFTGEGYAQPKFFLGDSLEQWNAPFRVGSIVFNPPYSYRKGIAEHCCRRALILAQKRVCALLPNKWLASQARYHLFTQYPPAMVLHLTQRPSMPPGDRIALMGNRAFRGGMIDYCWIVWDVTEATAPGETRTLWLPPLGGGQ